MRLQRIKEQLVVIAVLAPFVAFMLCLFGAFGEGNQMAMVETLREMTATRVIIYNQ